MAYTWYLVSCTARKGGENVSNAKTKAYETETRVALQLGAKSASRVLERDTAAIPRGAPPAMSTTATTGGPPTAAARCCSLLRPLLQNSSRSLLEVLLNTPSTINSRYSTWAKVTLVVSLTSCCPSETRSSSPANATNNNTNSCLGIRAGIAPTNSINT